ESREAILTLDVDTLVLAALENQITQENMGEVKASFIVEAANAPVTTEADHYLSNEHVIIIPDILANAGGVIVSYFEWLQGRETQYYSEEMVFEKLYEKMNATCNRIYPQFFSANYTLREVGYMRSVRRLSTI